MVARVPGAGSWWARAETASFRLCCALPFLALAFVLRVHALGTQSLWLDEALSVNFAQTPTAELFSRLAREDIHPPLYETMLHVWIQLAGAGEFAVRFPSLLAGLLLVAVSYRLALDLFSTYSARSLGGGSAALVVAGLTSCSSFLVYYSQEARNYIFVALFTVLASLVFWRALNRAGRAYWAMYGVVAAVVAYTHYYGGFVLIAHFLFLLVFVRGKRQLLSYSAAAGLALLLYLPWLFGLSGQLANLLRSPDYWFGDMDFLTLAVRMVASVLPAGIGLAGAAIAAIGLVALAAAAWWLGRSTARGESGLVFLLAYTLVPLAVVYAITARNPKFAERYLIMIVPAVYLLFAQALHLVWRLAEWLANRPGAASLLKGAVVSVGAVAVALSLGSTVQSYGSGQWAKDDFRGAVGYIEKRLQPGDFVLLVRNSYHPYLYYRTRDVPWLGLDPVGPNQPANPLQVADELNKRVPGHKRVWMLLWQEEVVDSTRAVAGLLERYGRPQLVEAEFHGLGLRLFEMPADVNFQGSPSVATVNQYANGVELMGYDLPQQQVPSGERYNLGLYWRVLSSNPEEFGVSLTLKSEDGLVWSNTTLRAAGPYLPVSRWPSHYPIRGNYDLVVPPGTPPGKYQLELNVHDARTLAEVSRVMANGQPVGTRLKLAELTVLSPLPPAWGGPARVDNQAEAGAAQESGLLGWSQLPTALDPGFSHELELLWLPLRLPSGEPALRVELVGEGTVALYDGPLLASPAPYWPETAPLRQQYVLRVPPSAPAGTYRIIATVKGSASELELGRLEVNPLARLTEAPAVQQRQDSRFGEEIILYGFAYSAREMALSADGHIELQLVWQALQAPQRAYKVFVHVADETGRPWAQLDSEPVAGQRPTDGWIAGEYVVDQLTIPLSGKVPPGEYRLLVGLYDENGTRLPVTTAGVSGPADCAQLKDIMVQVR